MIRVLLGRYWQIDLVLCISWSNCQSRKPNYYWLWKYKFSKYLCQTIPVYNLQQVNEYIHTNKHNRLAKTISAYHIFNLNGIVSAQNRVRLLSFILFVVVLIANINHFNEKVFKHLMATNQHRLNGDNVHCRCVLVVERESRKTGDLKTQSCVHQICGKSIVKKKQGFKFAWLLFFVINNHVTFLTENLRYITLKFGTHAHHLM